MCLISVLCWRGFTGSAKDDEVQRGGENLMVSTTFHIKDGEATKRQDEYEQCTACLSTSILPTT